MMSVKSRITQVPGLSGLARWYGRTMTDRDNNRVIRSIAGSPYRQGVAIADAVRSIGLPMGGEEERDVAAIEELRGQYANHTGLLIDGSLGPGGLYDQGITVGRAFAASKPVKACRFLYKLVRFLKPDVILELGTNTGISSAYMASALRRNGNGRLVTLDASPYRQKIARTVHQGLNLANVEYVTGLFTDTLASVLDELKRVDLAFIDGHHQYQPTLDYFALIEPYCAPDGVCMFDDIRWSAGMEQAWKELQHDQRTGLSVDLNAMGLTTLRRDDIGGPFVMKQLYSL
ncbi:MAG: class I SAM-dependent methyltransferase [Flavobacteriales bacterium]|nr:class I SAM-dependent methyltransferase [Flavobacteriales bacterium]MEB2342582.1 class I SAM-dependent methyltransferase [Flavobacteriia bacterium]